MKEWDSMHAGDEEKYVFVTRETVFGALFRTQKGVPL